MLAGSSCASKRPAATSPASTTTPPVPPTVGGPLIAPKTSSVQDAQYYTDLAEVDPGLATYVNTYGDTALQALITDGAAFCAFLKRGTGIDDAMASVVEGANGVEPQTHLPQNITTYNAIDAVAL